MARGDKAFTLAELLVVLAIIGVLAPMVLPVFARTRELARDARCLANVKNIALAIQMYLADNNDTLPPMETNPRVLDWFAANAPNWPSAATCYEAPTLANPYLRWPVILDEYVKNRAVWQCPSARHDNVAGNVNPSPDWFAAVAANKAKLLVQGWGGLCPLGNE